MLEDYLINGYAHSVSELDDVPDMSADELKAVFDARSNEEIKESINGIIETLISENGADNIFVGDKSIEEALSEKVDKISGKGLSANDYTDADKASLAGKADKSYVDGELSGKVDKISGKGLSANDYTDADKASLAAKADKSEIPISTSELVNDSGFISNTASDLLNYYLKSETYTKDEVNYIISQISTVTLVKVDELPEAGEPNKIYLVPKEPKESNNFDEYIWVDNAWELIGSTEIDVSGTYPNMSVGQATKDGDGNVISSTYAKKNEGGLPLIPFEDFLEFDETLSDYGPIKKFGAFKIQTDTTEFYNFCSFYDLPRNSVGGEAIIISEDDGGDTDYYATIYLAYHSVITIYSYFDGEEGVWVNEVKGSNLVVSDGAYPNMTVGKAQKDGNGNVITTTYATKEEIVINPSSERVLDIDVKPFVDGERVKTYRAATGLDNVRFYYSGTWQNDSVYECNLFVQGQDADDIPLIIEVIPSNAPIKFYGDDCDENGIFTPVLGVPKYEISLKYLGKDLLNKVNIVGRVARVR